MSDEEGGNTGCCAPFLALTEPIEVSELGHVKTICYASFKICLLHVDVIL